MTFKVSGSSAEHIRGLTSELGAVLTGRRTFEVAHGWDGSHAWGPAFALTYQIPDGWPRPNSTVHFVTDGIESAVNQYARRSLTLLARRELCLNETFTREASTTCPQVAHRPTQRAPDGWDSARFLDLFLSFGDFPFPSVILPSRR